MDYTPRPLVNTHQTCHNEPMLLRYLDSQYGAFWRSVHPDFAPVEGAYAHTPQAAKAREHYWDQMLPRYEGEDPLLLLLHVSEKTPHGHQFQLPRGWSEQALKKVIIVAMSAGGSASAWLAAQPAGPRPRIHALENPILLNAACREAFANWLSQLTLENPGFERLQWASPWPQFQALFETEINEAWPAKLRQLQQTFPQELALFISHLWPQASSEVKQQLTALGLNPPQIQLPALGPLALHPPENTAWVLGLNDQPNPQWESGLQVLGYRARWVPTPAQARRFLSRYPVTVLFCDLFMPTPEVGYDFLQRVAPTGVACVIHTMAQLPSPPDGFRYLHASASVGHLHQCIWELSARSVLKPST